MDLIYPVVRLKVGCVCLVAIVKQDNNGKCTELGYAVFCGDTFVGRFADLTDALKRFKAEVDRVYPNPAERPNIVFVDATGTNHHCATLAEAKESLLKELARLKFSDLPALVASIAEIIKVCLRPPDPPEPFPQP